MTSGARCEPTTDLDFSIRKNYHFNVMFVSLLIRFHMFGEDSGTILEKMGN